MTGARGRVGEAEVAVICEGFAALPLEDELPGQSVDWAAERTTHPWAFLDERTWPWHVHAFALRTASGVTLVDVGLGEYPPFRPWVEQTDRDLALSAAGVEAEEVRTVVHTHLHADHAGGAVVGGRPRFPNAVHHVHPADWSFFGRADEIDGYTSRGPMAELESLGMLDLTEADHEVVPGIRVVHTPGHTPGHRVVLLQTGEEPLLLTGDLLHVPAQIARPEAPSSHDQDAEGGSRWRARLVRMAEAGRWRVAVSHFAQPFGRVVSGAWRGEG